MSTTADAPRRIGPAVDERQFGKWSATLTVMIGMMTTILSSTMINVAIPDIMGAFGVGQDRAQWMSSGFLAAMTCLMLLNAWFVQNLGVRNTFTLAIVVFSAASIYGQTAADFNVVVACRVIQGACAGLLQPLAMTVIYASFPPKERGMAMGIFGMGVVFGPAIGPTIGGIIVDNADWRFVFTAALPITGIAGLLGMRFLPGRDDSLPRVNLNWISFALVCIAVATLLTGIANGQRQGWGSVYVNTYLLVAFLAAAGFIMVESRTANPIIQVRLFADRTFAISAIVAFMFGVGMFGSFYIVPIFVQTILGFTATKAGMMLMVAGIGLLVVFPIAGRLAGQVAPGYPIATGMCLFGVSSFALAGATVDSSFWFLAAWSAFGRVGLGLITPSLNTGALAAIRPDLVPYGAGGLNFIRMLGGALGVNVLAVILEQRTELHTVAFKATQTSANSQTQELLRHVYEVLAQQGIVAIDATRIAMAYLGRTVNAKASMLAFQDGFMILGLSFTGAALAALLLTRKPGR